MVATRDYVLPLDKFEHASSFGSDLKKLRGRSVVLSVGDMAKVGAALIDLDGCARRILLVPPGWESWRLGAAARDAEADVVVYDDEDVATPTFGRTCRRMSFALAADRFASIRKHGNRMDTADFGHNGSAQARQAYATHSHGRNW